MYKIAVAMNPIETLDPTKDSTFSLMNQLQVDAELLYILPGSLVLDNKIVKAEVSKVSIDKLTGPSYKLSKTKKIQLNKIDAILFNTNYCLLEVRIVLAQELDLHLKPLLVRKLH